MLKSKEFSLRVIIRERVIIADALTLFDFVFALPRQPDPNAPLHGLLLFYQNIFSFDPATGSPTAALLRLVSDLEPYTHSLLLVRARLHLR